MSAAPPPGAAPARPSAPLPPPPVIGEDQRLVATVVLSLLLHALVILGIGFALKEAAPVVPMLDVILTQTRTPLSPKQADFLAQANNQGGGEDDKARRPRDPQPGTVPQTETGTAPQTVRAQSPAPSPPPEARVVTSTQAEDRLPQPNRKPQPLPDPLRTGDRKIEHDMAMARLAAEIHLRSSRYAKRPSRKFVSASTQEYVWATYLRAWVDRAERVGNLNYPDEARRRKLSGTVVINIGIRRNGTIERADVVQSSGIPLLDESALRIARLAEPYPPLPKTQENPDILNVVRTWRFMPGGELIDE
jgi:protein TonB